MEIITEIQIIFLIIVKICLILTIVCLIGFIICKMINISLCILKTENKELKYKNLYIYDGKINDSRLLFIFDDENKITEIKIKRKYGRIKRPIITKTF